MNSRNQKQEELIRRLEDIRRQRTSMQTKQNETTIEQPARRNEHAGEMIRRNRNKQPRQTTRQKRQTISDHSRGRNTKPATVTAYEEMEHYSQEMHSSEHKAPNEVYANRVMEANKRDELRAQSLKAKKRKAKKKQSNPLIGQLSNKESVRQAIILNEVLSKPIALRHHSR